MTRQKRHQNTSITQRLRTDLGSQSENDSHPIGVVKPVYRIQTFPITAKAVLAKGHSHIDITARFLLVPQGQHTSGFVFCKFLYMNSMLFLYFIRIKQVTMMSVGPILT